MPGSAIKSHLLFYLLICLLFQFLARERASAAAFTMGRLQTVASDGSMDVIRNPSLLTMQKSDNSIGIILLSAPYSHHLYSYQFYQSPWITSGHWHDAKYVTGSAFLSYCRKTQNGVVGLALDTDNSYQGIYTRYGKAYSSVMSGFLTRIVIRGKSEQAAPRFVLSYGATVSGNHSVGFQCAAEYVLLHDDTRFLSVLNYQPYQKNYTKNRTEEVRAELSFGYSYRDADSQAGLMIRSGRLGWRKTKLHYSHMDVLAPLLFYGGLREPFSFQYDRGFTLIGGGYHKLASFIAIALEGTYEIPVSYTQKEVVYNETTGFFGVMNFLAVVKSGLYGLKAGFEILPSGPVTISLGGGMSTTRESRKDKYLSESVSTDEFGGTLGLDIKFAENLILMAGSQLSYTRKRIVSRTSYIIIGAFMYDGPARLLNLNVFTGMSCGF